MPEVHLLVESQAWEGETRNQLRDTEGRIRKRSTNPDHPRKFVGKNVNRSRLTIPDGKRIASRLDWERRVTYTNSWKAFVIGDQTIQFAKGGKRNPLLAVFLSLSGLRPRLSTGSVVHHFNRTIGREEKDKQIVGLPTERNAAGSLGELNLNLPTICCHCIVARR